ncbi:MAG: 2Fe-2S iron-sulfur cluster-binding protein [Flavobacteriaceae bacterium]
MLKLRKLPKSFFLDIQITVTDREESVHSIIAPTDMAMNLMEVCKAHELPVEGTCGGMALCASCQCYIQSNHQLPEKSADEEAMLAEAFHVKANSRLACQIPITSDLDGLHIALAPED